LTLPDYALQILTASSRPVKALPVGKLKTGAELVEYWLREDLLGPVPAVNNAPEDARKTREEVQNRNWTE
jgi:hypothetical protein